MDPAPPNLKSSAIWCPFLVFKTLIIWALSPTAQVAWLASCWLCHVHTLQLNHSLTPSFWNDSDEIWSPDLKFLKFRLPLTRQGLFIARGLIGRFDSLIWLGSLLIFLFMLSVAVRIYSGLVAIIYFFSLSVCSRCCR